MSLENGHVEVQQWVTFRELDQRNGWTKGTAFKRFKAVHRTLDEGVDFKHLDARRDGAEIDALRLSQRVYTSTVNAVLLSVRVASELEKD